MKLKKFLLLFILFLFLFYSYKSFADLDMISSSITGITKILSKIIFLIGLILFITGTYKIIKSNFSSALIFLFFSFILPIFNGIISSLSNTEKSSYVSIDKKENSNKYQEKQKDLNVLDSNNEGKTTLKYPEKIEDLNIQEKNNENNAPVNRWNSKEEF